MWPALFVACQRNSNEALAGSCVQPLHGHAQIARRHDVVTLEHAGVLCPVICIGHALRDACPDEASHGRPPEVVRDAARAPGSPTRRPPRFREADDALRLRLAATTLRDLSEQHLRNNVTGFLQPFVLGVLRLEDGAEFVGEREHAAIAVPFVRADPLGVQKPPFQGKDFRLDLGAPGAVCDGDPQVRQPDVC